MKYMRARAGAQSRTHVGAHLFLAELAIDNDKRDEARAAVAKAQAINPNSLEAHALQGGRSPSSRARTTEYKAAIAAALKINPLYGEAYRVVGAVTAQLLPLR